MRPILSTPDVNVHFGDVSLLRFSTESYELAFHHHVSDSALYIMSLK